MKAMEQKVRHCPGCKRNSCTGCGIFQKLNTNKNIPVNLPEFFVPEKQSGFGVSFDLGTTTLAGMLWDLEQALCLGAEAVANPQAKWGADVISRLQYAMQGEKELLLLQKAVVQALDQLALSMARESFGQTVSFERAVVVGNTAMCQLLMAVRPEGLSRAPFRPDYGEIRHFKGESLGFVALAETEVIMLPPIGGYVGADALAVYSCIHPEADEGEKKLLAVDIGTNGEILLLNGREHYACSAAAGPALEGGGAACGMRAARGAIDRVSLCGSFPMQDLVCHVIGEGEPAGICGSGLLDALAALIGAKIVDETGYLRSAKEAERKGASKKLANRISEAEDKEGKVKDNEGRVNGNEGRTEEKSMGRRIRLTPGEPSVYLYAQDIRHLQLAIGAIRAGIEVLLAKAGLKAEELDGIYLAGTFGSYIRVESCMDVGLLPKVNTDKVIQAGNLAGVGAAMALLSPRFMKAAEKKADKLIHIELAGDKRFEELFLQYMNFRSRE